MAHTWRITIYVCMLHLGISLAQVAPSNVDCTGVPAGTRMWGCKAYHECQADGSSVYVECRWEMVYNELSRKCEHSSEVDTPCGTSYRRECRDYGPPFGKIAVKDYMDPNTGLPCQYFFTCANGHFYGTQKCKGFQVFNEILQYCVKPEAAPASCNPFGPQVANVQEVKRHWWKSDAAGKSRAAKQPWWKARNSKADVQKSAVKHKHWLTRSAAARKSKSLYPKLEKMLVKNKVTAQEKVLSQQKIAPPRRKFVQRRKKLVQSTMKTLPPGEKVSTKEKIVASIVKKIPTKKTSLPPLTTTVELETNSTVTSSTVSPSSPAPRPHHPWNAKGKSSSSRSIVPREKSHSSSTS